MIVRNEIWQMKNRRRNQGLIVDVVKNWND